jgi:hypothetical protein
MKACLFCQNDTRYVPIKISDLHIFHVHYCNICNVEYLYWPDNGNIGGIYFYTVINHQTYRWHSATTHYFIKEARLWHIITPSIPGISRPRNAKLLKLFVKDIPNITPYNIHDKLKTLLKFL